MPSISAVSKVILEVKVPAEGLQMQDKYLDILRSAIESSDNGSVAIAGSGHVGKPRSQGGKSQVPIGILAYLGTCLGGVASANLISELI
jgi:hypothetical protein